MKNCNRLLLSLGFAAALFGAALSFAPKPAEASVIKACAPEVSGAARGPRSLAVPGSTVASAYSLNTQGCAIVGLTDVGWLASQGFTFDIGVNSVRVTNVSATPSAVILPAGAVISRIIAEEISGGTVTGALKVGTQAGGSQICCATGFTVGFTASSPSIATDGNIKIFSPSSTASTPLFFDTTGAYGSGRLNFTVQFGYY